jgi:hypothetical protein
VTGFPGASRLRRRLPAALMAIVLTVLATVAMAGGAPKAKKAEVTLAPGDLGTASVNCRRGTRVTSGGFDVPGFTADSSTFVLTTASVRDGGRTWSSSAENNSSSPSSGTLVDFAYCSDELPRLRTKSKSSDTVPNGGVKSLTVHCPRGGEAIAGGFKTPGSGMNQVALFESRRIGQRQWRVTGEGTSLSESRLRAFAYCASDKLGLEAKASSDSTDQESTDVAAKAKCKRGERPISGGFEMEGDAGAGAYVTPFESKRVHKRGWKASAASYSGDNTVTWKVYAYCLDGGNS